MGVYEVIPHPKGHKVVGNRWVFHIKCRPNGTIQKYKARLVAQGFIQVKNINYNETFAPISKFASLCAILALAAKEDLEVHQINVKSTYLNGILKQEIFMKALPGFDIPEGMVLHLIKAVYSTKQGGRVWYDDIRSTLQSIGYTHTDADHTIFIHLCNSTCSIITLYVDDITMVSNNLETINQNKETLKKHYEMMGLGEIAWILGIYITCNCNVGWIALSQEKFIIETLERFGKGNVYPISTPALINKHLKKLTIPEIDIKSYQSAVGALMYSGLQKCCNVLQFQIVCSVALYGMEITLSIIERK
jgi:reverse transcriptase-like protein